MGFPANFEGPAGQVVLKNQFGEETANAVISTDAKFSQKLPPKSGVTAISALPTPVTAVTITLSTSNTYTDAAVNTAVNAALASVVTDLQTQLTQINTLLAALKATS